MPGPQILCSISARSTQDAHAQHSWHWGQNCSLSLFDKALGNSVTALPTSVIMPFSLNTL